MFTPHIHTLYWSLWNIVGFIIEEVTHSICLQKCSSLLSLCKFQSLMVAYVYLRASAGMDDVYWPWPEVLNHHPSLHPLQHCLKSSFEAEQAVLSFMYIWVFILTQVSAAEVAQPCNMYSTVRPHVHGMFPEIWDPVEPRYLCGSGSPLLTWLLYLDHLSPGFCSPDLTTFSPVSGV